MLAYLEKFLKENVHCHASGNLLKSQQDPGVAVGENHAHPQFFLSECSVQVIRKLIPCHTNYIVHHMNPLYIISLHPSLEGDHQFYGQTYLHNLEECGWIQPAPIATGSYSYLTHVYHSQHFVDSPQPVSVTKEMVAN